jgi:hypothetical protein
MATKPALTKRIAVLRAGIARQRAAGPPPGFKAPPKARRTLAKLKQLI